MRREIFNDMFDEIHIDKKWFYLKQVKHNYYIGNQEGGPYFPNERKKFIKNIMFLDSVESQCWDTMANCVFDGKIGIQHLITRYPAGILVRNQCACDIITKAITSTTENV